MVPFHSCNTLYKRSWKAEKFFGAESRYPSSAVFQADEVIFMSVASRQKNKLQFHKENLSMPKINLP